MKASLPRQNIVCNPTQKNRLIFTTGAKRLPARNMVVRQQNEIVTNINEKHCLRESYEISWRQHMY